MKTFTDSAGRTWTVNITVDAIKRVKDLIGVNLADVTEPEREGEPPLMTRLDVDLILLCDVIYAIVKPQADQQGVSDEQFGQALGGEAIQQARDAFWEALTDFFRQLRRQDTVRAIDKQQEMVRAAVEATEQRMDRLEIDRLLEQTMEDEPLPRWMEGKTPGTTPGTGPARDGASSGNSPGRSASTPDP